MPPQTAPPAQVGLFDLNGTLPDISVLNPHSHDALSSLKVRPVWFSQLTRLMLTAGAALKMALALHGAPDPAGRAGGLGGLGVLLGSALGRGKQEGWD